MPEAAFTDHQLQRILSRRDLILYGLVILTPTAPFPVYGIVQQTSNGHAALSYLVAMVAMLFTAASYGKMSSAFPSAGSTYTYAQRALNPHIGFLAGWAMILDYFLIPLLSVIYAALTANRMLPVGPVCRVGGAVHRGHHPHQCPGHSRYRAGRQRDDGADDRLRRPVRRGRSSLGDDQPRDRGSWSRRTCFTIPALFRCGP